MGDAAALSLRPATVGRADLRRGSERFEIIMNAVRLTDQATEPTSRASSARCLHTRTFRDTVPDAG